MSKLKKSKPKKVKKNKKETEEEKVRKRQWNGCISLLISVLLFFCLYSPESVGVVGEAIKNVLFACCGHASHLIWIVLFWFGILYVRPSSLLRFRLDTIYASVSLFFVSVFLSLLKLKGIKNIEGGYIGDMVANIITAKNLLTETTAAVICGVVAFFFITSFFRISVIDIIAWFFTGIIDDIKKWREKKEELKQQQEAYNETKKQGKPKILKEDRQEKQKSDKEQDEPFGQDVTPNIINAAADDEKKRKQQEEERKRIEEAEKARLKKEAAFQDKLQKQKSQTSQEQTTATQQPEEQKEKIDTTQIKYTLPTLDLLKDTGGTGTVLTNEQLQERAEKLRETLVAFNIDAVVKDIIPGPVITRYDIILKPGVKIQTVTNISENISLAMQTSAIRIEPIPEKSAVGIEIPNPKAAVVGLRSILKGDEFTSSQSLLTIGLGTTTEGKGYIANLAKMPHLLIAGSTGSGKSVGIHSIIISILYKARPDEVKFMLIDPKRVEMTLYKDIPHLYNPCTMAEDATVITQPKGASEALKQLVGVMERRYDNYAANMVRNIDEYNAKMAETGGEKDYYIVVIIDELADLMLVASKEIEDSIQRLAQMARAVGIHLILATQRPSVNVITGVIKANFPARMSFQTTSAIDSKVILDTIGAEELIGKGDMLYLSPSAARPVRLQGAFISTKEAEKVVEFISNQDFPKIYDIPKIEVSANALPNFEDKATKDLIPAMRLILERRQVSQDILKANFGGSARASNILSVLNMKGFIYKPEGTNRWQVNFDLIEDYLKNNDLNS